MSVRVTGAAASTIPTPPSGKAWIFLDSGTGALSYKDDTGTVTAIALTDIELLAIAGLTSAANKIPMFSGSGTAVLLDLDTDGTLAANSDAKLASQKAVKTYADTALALKAALASPTFTGTVTVPTATAKDNSTKAASTAYVDTPEAWVALTDGATITWNVGGTREAKGSVTLGGSRTLSITNAVNGSAGIIRVTQDGTGSRGLTLPSGSKIVGGGGTTAPLSTAAGTVDLLAFEYDGTNYWWTIGKAAA